MTHFSKRSVTAIAIGMLALSTAPGAQARDTKHIPAATTQPAAEGQAAPVSAEPQQTSASFGDWIVRCERVTVGASVKRLCEVAQALVVKGQEAPIAQIAFGHGPDESDGALRLTVLLPINVAFDKPPTLGSGGDDQTPTPLTYRRCVPSGCLADEKVEPAVLALLRGAQKPGRLMFTDAAERTITLPVSFRGLPQALDDLAKEQPQAMN